jgi:hypothetical protein
VIRKNSLEKPSVAIKNVYNVYQNLLIICSITLKPYYYITILKSYLYCKMRSHVNSETLQEIHPFYLFIYLFFVSVLPEFLFQPKHVVSKF